MPGPVSSRPGGAFLALVGTLLLGGGLGYVLGTPGASSEEGVSDGSAAFGVLRGDRTIATDWGQFRVSSSQRSFALADVGLHGRPQMLVFPKESAWPALAAPRDWCVAWLTRDGQVLEVQIGTGEPLVSSNPSRAAKAVMLFAVPPGSKGLFDALKEGGAVVWSKSLPTGIER